MKARLTLALALGIALLAIGPAHAADAPALNPQVRLAVDAAEAAAKEAGTKATVARTRQAAAQAVAVKAREAAEKAEGKANGYGILTGTGTADTRPTWRYAGQVKARKENGLGVEIWSSGERNEGEFKDDSEDGLVVASYISGTRYEGEFRSAKRNGSGVYSWNDGDRYEGEFRNANRTGHGVYIAGETKDFASKSGQWLDGRLTGYAVIVAKDGTRMAGAVRDDKLDGFGATFDAEGGLIEQGIYEFGVLKTALMP